MLNRTDTSPPQAHRFFHTALIRADSDDLGAIITALMTAGNFTVALDMVDVEHNAVWVTASLSTILTLHRFLDWVYDIVIPLGGWVAETGTLPCAVVDMTAASMLASYPDREDAS